MLNSKKYEGCQYVFCFYLLTITYTNGFVEQLWGQVRDTFGLELVIEKPLFAGDVSVDFRGRCEDSQQMALMAV